jgi:2-amino-4-hydroxy-6-hydroxymethyldihydropteridine diphosphokinase
MRDARPWVPAWIGIGSNLDDPVARVRRALADLGGLPDTRAQLASSLYWNPPMGGMDQPDYVNAVAGLLTRLAAADLLAALHGLERAQGRDRGREVRWGARRLDLDLLVYGERRSDDHSLRLPHPGIRDRNFVLLPLLQIAPGLQIPGLGCVERLARGVDPAGLRLIP